MSPIYREWRVICDHGACVLCKQAVMEVILPGCGRNIILAVVKCVINFLLICPLQTMEVP